MKLFWKIYSVSIISIIVLLILATLLFFGGQWQIKSFGSLLLVLPAALPFIGLIAFAWKKRLGWQWVWKIIAWIIIVVSILDVIDDVVNMVNQDESCFGMWCYAIIPPALLLGLPIAVGIYLYAYRSPEIWMSAKTK